MKMSLMLRLRRRHARKPKRQLDVRLRRLLALQRRLPLRAVLNPRAKPQNDII